MKSSQSLLQMRLLVHPYPPPSSHTSHRQNNNRRHHRMQQFIHQRGEAEDAIVEGKEQLEILKRQVVLGHLYPTARSVMETA